MKIYVAIVAVTGLGFLFMTLLMAYENPESPATTTIRVATAPPKAPHEGSPKASPPTRPQQLLRPEQTPSAEFLQRDLANTLYAKAIDAFQKNDLEKAIELLRRSVALGNKQARAALAKVLVVKGQSQEATGILEEHFVATKDKTTLEALIDLQMNLAKFEDAEKNLRVYQEMFLLQNDKEDVGRSNDFFKARSSRLKAKMDLNDKRMVISRDEVQVTYFQGNAEGLAEAILTSATQTIDSLRQKFGPANWGYPFNIDLVEAQGFAEWSGAPTWAGAIFDGTIRIPYNPQSIGNAANWTMLRRMTQHETTHAYLYSLCGERVPSWMGEGLAQIQEGRSFKSAEQALKNLHQEKWKERRGDLEQAFVDVTDTNEVRDLYLRSLFLSGSLEQEFGSGIWKRFIQQMCTMELPYPEALEASFSARSVDEIWNHVTHSR